MAIATLDRPATPGEAPVMPTRIERRKMARRHPLAVAMPWLVALVTLVLRLVTAATGPTDWDSAQYAAAVGHFDVLHGQPQPPGYWLYVEAGRLVHQMTGLGTVRSLVVITALTSAAAAGITAVAGRDLGGWWVGLAAGAVMATSPFAWFSGSIVATYSFDALGCSLLIVLAWRARPGSGHGVAAVVALGLLAGFRPSVLQAFAVLALIAVVASTRRWSRLLLTVMAGILSVGLWMIPMAVEQPGGLRAWGRATRTEAAGAAHASSVLDHAVGGATNLGTFAATTVVAVAPLALVTVLGALALLVRTAARRTVERKDTRSTKVSMPVPGLRGGLAWRRPWYQSRTTILVAAVIPPALLVSLVEFAKGGYLLAYLPAMVIALLLPLAALNRTNQANRANRRHAPTWLVLTSLGLVLVVLLGGQRFLGDTGVLPKQWTSSTGALWLQQPRYQAPFPDTRASIRTADAIDTALRGLDRFIDATNDEIVFDTPDGGASIYRNAGWELPNDRIALIMPGQVEYNELHGALYYTSGHTTAVGPSGSVFLVASPALPGLNALAVRGDVLAVATSRPIGGYRVWQLRPGTSILGVRVVEQSGPRPLGSGI